MAKKITTTYMSVKGSELARFGWDGVSRVFPTGTAWTGPTPAQNSASCSAPLLDTDDGDQVLANTILRMRDSMLHYEFQSAISDGDIGRAMNIMAVRILNITRWRLLIMTVTYIPALDIHVLRKWKKQVYK